MSVTNTATETTITSTMKENDEEKVFAVSDHSSSSQDGDGDHVRHLTESPTKTSTSRRWFGGFGKKKSRSSAKPPKTIDKKALTILMEKPWTGNIREFRNVIERLIILTDKTITAKDVESFA